MLNHKYFILPFFLLINILNQIDRNILASFAPQITAELDLSNTQFGLLTGVFFAVFYSVSGLLMGIAADRYNRSRLIAAGLFIWSALTAATGMARSFVEISAARMLVSVGESSLVPSATSFLSDTFPAKQRATALGIFFTGIPLGLGGSYLIAGYLGPMLGWRGVFMLLGVAGIALTAVMLLIKDPGRGGQGVDDGAPAVKHNDSVMTASRTLVLLWSSLRENSVLRYVMAGIITMHFFYAGQIFSQLWLVDELGFDWAEIVTIYGMITLGAGTTGSLLGGMLCDWYCHRFGGTRAGFIVIVGVVFAPFMLAFRFVEPGSALFFVCMTSGFLFITTVYGSFFSLLQEVSPLQIRATIVGATMLSLNFIAMGIGSIIFGFGSDTLADMGFDKPLTVVLFASDVLALLSIPCFIRVIFLRRALTSNPDSQNFSL